MATAAKKGTRKNSRNLLRGRRAVAVHAGPADLMNECLEPVIDYLIRTGHSPQKVAQRVHALCSESSEPTQPFDIERMNRILDVPHVIGRWHHESQYVDEQGDPRPLPLDGPPVSLSSLSMLVLPRENPAIVIKYLLDKSWIRETPSGKYLPTHRHCIYSPEDVAFHSLTVLRGVLGTMRYNQSAPESEKVLERVAMNPNFPLSELPRLQRPVKAKAQALLDTTDSVFQDCEGASHAEERGRVGLGIYVFLDRPLESRWSAESSASGVQEPRLIGRGRKPRRKR